MTYSTIPILQEKGNNSQRYNYLCLDYGEFNIRQMIRVSKTPITGRIVSYITHDKS